MLCYPKNASIKGSSFSIFKIWIPDQNRLGNDKIVSILTSAIPDQKRLGNDKIISTFTSAIPDQNRFGNDDFMSGRAPTLRLTFCPDANKK